MATLEFQSVLMFLNILKKHKNYRPFYDRFGPTAASQLIVNLLIFNVCFYWNSLYFLFAIKVSPERCLQIMWADSHLIPSPQPNP